MSCCSDGLGQGMSTGNEKETLEVMEIMYILPVLIDRIKCVQLLLILSTLVFFKSVYLVMF